MDGRGGSQNYISHYAECGHRASVDTKPRGQRLSGELLGVLFLKWGNKERTRQTVMRCKESRGAQRSREKFYEGKIIGLIDIV